MPLVLCNSDRGFFVKQVGRQEDAIRVYIRDHEKEDQGTRIDPFLPLKSATASLV